MAETRSLGLDIGDRWIGVAMSDPQGILASPLTIIRRTDEPSDVNAILAIIDQNQVGMVVAGLPLSMRDDAIEVRCRPVGGGAAPEATFDVAADSPTAREHCTLHGLWKGE